MYVEVTNEEETRTQDNTFQWSADVQIERLVKQGWWEMEDSLTEWGWLIDWEKNWELTEGDNEKWHREQYNLKNNTDWEWN